MKIPVIAIAVSLALFPVAHAQTASEIPLTNPEVLEPPSRSGEISPSPDASPGTGGEEVADNPQMTLERLGQIVKAVDPDAVIGGRGMLLTIADVKITVISDPSANRMRAFAAFKTLDGVDGQQLYRMMQANFDAALDARYAIAKGHLISVFIHPLAELQKDQFIEGLGQVVNLVKTFGTAYTSGATTFGGGDSNAIHRALIDELLQKGERI